MEELKEIRRLYNQYKIMGYCANDASKKSLQETLPTKHVHIYKDEYGEANHIFYNGSCLFFDSKLIYTVNKF